METEVSRQNGGRMDYAIPDFQFRFHIHATHWRTVPATWRYPEHSHHFLEINIVLDGRQVTTAGGETWTQERGDMLILKSGEVHSSRAEGDAGMTYLCIHLDIDDEILNPLLNRMPCTFIAGESAIGKRLGPHIQRLVELQNGGPGFATEVHNRVEMMHIIVNLVEWAASAWLTVSGNQRPQLPGQLRRIRERSLLENKIKLLLYESEANAAVSAVEESFYPPYRWIGVYLIRFADKTFWKKSDRFMAKLVLEEMLEPLGTVAVLVDEPIMAVVIFSSQFSVPPMEQFTARCKKVMEHTFLVDIESAFGGMTTDLSEVARLYKQSLRHIEAEKADSSATSIEFVHRVVRTAMQHIELHYNHPQLTLASLAHALDITPNYLSSLFVSETGLTFSQHLTRIRLEISKKMLRETVSKIYEISEAVGYSDPAYFNRLFKNAYNISPHKYRKMMAGSP